MAILAEGNALGSNVRKDSPCTGNPIFRRGLRWICPFRADPFVATLPRALPSAKMIQALGLMGPLRL